LGCSILRTICLPASVEILGQECFLDCGRLSRVSFECGSRLRAIEEGAFDHCDSLEAICLPRSLEMIDGAAFSHTHLREIEFEGGDCRFSVVDDMIVNATGSVGIASFGALRSVVIPSTIEFVGPRSFSRCDHLCTLVFESASRVHRIESEAFSCCRKLESIAIPSSVEVTCDNAFYGCTGMCVVDFEGDSQLSRIEECAFCWSGLQSICIPPLVDFIDGSAFSNTGLTSSNLTLRSSCFAVVDEYLVTVADISGSIFGTAQ
jgi:hypothetical protein